MRASEIPALGSSCRGAGRRGGLSLKLAVKSQPERQQLAPARQRLNVEMPAGGLDPPAGRDPDAAGWHVRGLFVGCGSKIAEGHTINRIDELVPWRMIPAEAAPRA